MMQITKSFSLHELTASETAARKGIVNNMLGKAEIDNLILLCEKVLQPLRDWYGKPINITSGYRSPKLNKAIGGSTNSDHTQGRAADFTVPRSDMKQVFNKLMTMDFDQLIWEFGDNNAPNWIHVSYRSNGNRKQVLRAYKNALRQTKYKPYQP
jgi:hypothetical protein